MSYDLVYSVSMHIHRNMWKVVATCPSTVIAQRQKNAILTTWRWNNSKGFHIFSINYCNHDHYHKKCVEWCWTQLHGVFLEMSNRNTTWMKIEVDEMRFWGSLEVFLSSLRLILTGGLDKGISCLNLPSLLFMTFNIKTVFIKRNHTYTEIKKGTLDMKRWFYPWPPVKFGFTSEFQSMTMWRKLEP